MTDSMGADPICGGGPPPFLALGLAIFGRGGAHPFLEGFGVNFSALGLLSKVDGHDRAVEVFRSVNEDFARTTIFEVFLEGIVWDS